MITGDQIRQARAACGPSAIRELQRLHGKKTLENEILREARSSPALHRPLGRSIPGHSSAER